MPYCYFTITKPQKDSVRDTGRCGNMNSLRSKNFVLVKSNGEFNPYDSFEKRGYFSSYEIGRTEHFKTEGKYQIQFHYSTDYDSLEQFAGDYYDTTLISFFKKIPKIQISSNIIEIEIKKN